MLLFHGDSFRLLIYFYSLLYWFFEKLQLRNRLFEYKVCNSFQFPCFFGRLFITDAILVLLLIKSKRKSSENQIFNQKKSAFHIFLFTQTMKAQFLITTILVSSALAQGYFDGSTRNLSLPFGSSSSFSSSSNFGSSSSSSFGSVQTQSFPTADLRALSTSTTSASVTAKNIASTIANAQKQNSVATQSFDSLFSKFPSQAELNNLVEAGDISAIMKTIQVVASDDSVPCQVKLSYLLELLGSVKYALSRKNLYVDQLITIINGAKNQIARLQTQIARLQADRNSLNLPGIQATISNLIAKLQVYYDQINALKPQIDPEKARIIGLQNEKITIQKQSDEERNRISNDKLKLVSTINSIKDLQDKLRDLRSQQTAFEGSISRSEGIIRDNDNRLNNIKNTIADINSRISGIQAQMDAIKKSANTYEVDLERARSDLAVNQLKDNNIVNEIKNLKERITIEQKKLVEDDLRNLQRIVTNLNSAIVQIQSGIDRQYYYCYGAGSVQIEKAGDTIIYVVRGDVFGKYVSNAYGQNLLGSNVRSTDLRLQVVNPFSEVWTSKFGSFFDSGSSVSSGSSYRCYSGSSGVSGRGKIRSIANGSISVADASGRSTQINIAPCSRLESTGQVPQIGQDMIYRGVDAGAGQLTLTQGTCF